MAIFSTKNVVISSLYIKKWQQSIDFATAHLGIDYGIIVSEQNVYASKIEDFAKQVAQKKEVIIEINNFEILHIGIPIFMSTSEIYGIVYLTAKNAEKNKITKTIEYLKNIIEFDLQTIENQKERELLLIKAQDQLSEERNIFQEGNVVIFKWKLEDGWPVTYTSPNVEQVFGYTAKEFMSQKIKYSDLIYKKDLENVVLNIRDAQKRNLDSFEHKNYRIIDKAGKLVWLYDYTTIIRDKKGNVSYYLGYVKDITEYKQNKENLLSLTDHLNLAIKTANIGIWDIDITNDHVTWNANMFKMYGISHNQKINYSDWLDLFYNEDILFADNFLKKTGDKFQKEYAEFKISHTNGNIKYIQIWTGAITSNSDNKLIRTTGICIDITDQKQHEQYKETLFKAVNKQKNEYETLYQKHKIQNEELLQANELLLNSEIRFKKLSNLTFEGILIHKEGIVTDLNSSYAEMFGYTREELLGKNIIELTILPKYHDKIHENMRQAYAPLCEAEAIRKNGQIFPIEIESRDLIYKGSEIRVTAIRDTTERKKAEKALLESEKNFRLLFEDSPLGIFTASPDGQILNANQALIEILGSPSIEETKKINVLKYPALVENKFSEDFLQAIQENKIIRKSYHYTSKWEKTAYLWEHIVPLKNDHGEIHKVYIIIENITEQKKIEQELITSKEKAEESDMLKTAFLNNLSHEIRTPMNGILGFTQLLSDPYTSDQDKNGFIKIIEKSGNNLLSIVDDIILISKIESKQEKLFFSECSINTILHKAFNHFEHVAKNKGLKFILEKQLPDYFPIIEIDENKLLNIINNLLSNAVKFTNDGSIKFGCTENNGSLHFFVKDTGIGIDTKMHDHIFDRFRQVEISSTREFGGLGLGLSISKAYVELLQGKIGLKSELNLGTTFTVSIPFVMPKKKIAISTKTASKQDDWTDKIFLIVEDDDINYKYIAELLFRTKATVLHATNGEEAIQICNENKIDIILMDLKMPKMDGYQATRLIKEKSPNLPIIAQTAYAFAEDKIKAKDAGCDDYISKPINPKKLIRIIKRYLH